MNEGGENMHFDASEPSRKMTMDLISSANDIRILYGMCDYLGKVDKIRLQFVLAPKSLADRQSVSSFCRFGSWKVSRREVTSGSTHPRLRSVCLVSRN